MIEQRMTDLHTNAGRRERAVSLTEREMKARVQTRMSALADAWARVEDQRDRVREARSGCARVTSALTLTPGGGRVENPMERRWIKLDSERRKCRDLECRAEELQERMEEALARVKTPEGRRVLCLRYLERRRWPEILETLRREGCHISERGLYRLHREAIRELLGEWPLKEKP